MGLDWDAVSEEEKDEDRVSDRGMSEGFREAIEGAFATTGLTRERAQDITDRVVDEVTRLGQDARGAIAGFGSPGAEDLESLEARIKRLEDRLSELERRGAPGDGPG